MYPLKEKNYKMCQIAKNACLTGVLSHTLEYRYLDYP